MPRNNFTLVILQTRSAPAASDRRLDDLEIYAMVLAVRAIMFVVRPRDGQLSLDSGPARSATSPMETPMTIPKQGSRPIHE